MTDDNENEVSKTLPTLRTERLILRPFVLEDAPIVQRLAGVWEIASMVQVIPYPYEDGLAEKWISTHQERFERDQGIDLAITLTDTNAAIGAISMSISVQNRHAEIGYWIGKDWWRNGYCTEAAGEIVRFGFEQLGLNRIIGRHLSCNPASGRVLQKIGMKYEGTQRVHVKRLDRFENLDCYGILKSDA